MQYAEAVFALLFLIFQAVSAVILLRRRRILGPGVGRCALALTLAWSCRLIPRILPVILPGRDLALWLGLGRLGYALGSAGWIFLLFRLWERLWSPRIRDRFLFIVCTAALLLRVLALIPPENRWLENGFSPLWSSLSCAGLSVAGAVCVVLWHSSRNQTPKLDQIWLLLLIDLLLEIPLGTAGGTLPVLRFLALPQMICAMGMTASFLGATRQ